MLNHLHGKMAVAVCAALTTAAAAAPVAINEVDYQNPGTDSTEWIELVGRAGTDLTGWTLELRNQANSVYGTFALSGTIANDFTSTWGGDGGFFVIGRFDATTAGTFGSVDLTPTGWPATNAVQNGPDDIIRLLDPNGDVVDEWQYDSSSAGSNSLTGASQAFDPFDSAGDTGDLDTYSSIGRRGYSFDNPIFVFDGVDFGGADDDPTNDSDLFDHNANDQGNVLAITEATDSEIFWSGTAEFGAGRGITPGTFNGASYGTAGMQDAYTINILPPSVNGTPIPEPASALVLGLAGGTLAMRRRRA